TVGEKRRAIPVSESTEVFYTVYRCGLRRGEDVCGVERGDDLSNEVGVVTVGVDRDRGSFVGEPTCGIWIFIEICHHAIDGDAGVQTAVGGGRGGEHDIGINYPIEVGFERRSRTCDGDRFIGGIEASEVERLGKIGKQVAHPLVARPIEVEVGEDRLVDGIPLGEIHQSTATGTPTFRSSVSLETPSAAPIRAASRVSATSWVRMTFAPRSTASAVAARLAGSRSSVSRFTISPKKFFRLIDIRTGLSRSRSSPSRRNVSRSSARVLSSLQPPKAGSTMVFSVRSPASASWIASNSVSAPGRSRSGGLAIFTTAASRAAQTPGISGSANPQMSFT